jgi:Protein of unknown function, DUF481
MDVEASRASVPRPRRFWDLSDGTQVTVRTRTGLRVPVAHGILASAELDLDRTRRPAEGVKPTESTLLLGAGYEW